MEKKQRKNKVYDKQKFLYFDFNNPDDVFVYDLLQKAPKRHNKLIAMMAKEFLDNFGISSEIAKDDLIQIIDNYDIVKNIKTKQVYSTPTFIPSVLPNAASEQIVQERNIVTEEKEETITDNEIKESISSEAITESEEVKSSHKSQKYLKYAKRDKLQSEDSPPATTSNDIQLKEEEEFFDEDELNFALSGFNMS